MSEHERRVKAVADTLMDLRMDGPWWTPPSTLTYQEAMRRYAEIIVAITGDADEARASQPLTLDVERNRTARLAALLAADPEAFDWITAKGHALGYAEGHASLDVERLRRTVHDLRWCKSSDMLHAVAHDDADEDGYRAAFVKAWRSVG